MNINPKNRMWRTLVRVTRSDQNGVGLIIPGWNVKKEVFCSYQAIPPDIFKDMKKDSRYHVGCNIGAEKAEDLCFDGWEKE
jgi:hypothetical protein